ncbi:hypothetical protein GJ496_006595 [Pomphorhynchus laevis]|nr:hypothetical protein GJ496_006595 [Pomphorhynchus laevis]
MKSTKDTDPACVTDYSGKHGRNNRKVRGRARPAEMQIHDSFEVISTEPSDAEISQIGCLSSSGGPITMSNSVVPSIYGSDLTQTTQSKLHDNSSPSIDTATIQYRPHESHTSCKLCAFVFLGRARHKNLIDHMAQHHDIHSIKLQCHLCGYLHTTPSGVSIHYRVCSEKYGDSLGSLPIVYKRDTSSNTLVESATVPLKQAPFQPVVDVGKSTICTVLLPTKEDHILACPACSYTISSRACYKQLVQHFVTNHPSHTLSFLCSYCEIFRSEKHISVRAHSASCKKKHIASMLSDKTISNDVIIASTIEVTSGNSDYSSPPSDRLNTYRDRSVYDNVSKQPRDSTDKDALNDNPYTVDVPQSLQFTITPTQQYSNEYRVIDVNRCENHATVLQSCNSSPSIVDVRNLTEHGRYAVSQCSSTERISIVDAQCSFHSSNSNLYLAEVVDHLNNLYNDSSAHPRLKRLIGSLLAESAIVEPDQLTVLLDKFVTIYTIYLTGIDEKRRPKNACRLKDMGMSAIQLKCNAFTTLHSISYCIYKNPRRHKDVARRITAELQNNPGKWRATVEESSDLASTYEDTVLRFKKFEFVSDFLVLRLASEAYQCIFRLIAGNAETDQVFSPVSSRRQPKSAHFLALSGNSQILPCAPFRGLSKRDHDDILRRRNRALYFNNTTKLANELLGNPMKIQCPLEPMEVFSHFSTLLSADSLLNEGTNEPQHSTNSCIHETDQDHSDFTIDNLSLLSALKSMQKNTAPGPG